MIVCFRLAKLGGLSELPTSLFSSFSDIELKLRLDSLCPMKEELIFDIS